MNYTWAHGLDDVNNAVDGDAAYGLIPSKISTYDYGSSPLDVTNRFAGTFNYELPYGKNGGALRKAVFGGIQFNGLGFWQNATPFGISSTATNPLTGRTYINLPVVTTERPDVIGPVHGGGSLAQFFNIGAFARQVSVGTAGNAGRNQVRGPHQRRGDLSLLKKFKIHEGYTGEFRVECFNITNTPNFAAPNANITAYSTTPDAQGRLEATDITGITAANPNGTRTGTFGQITATTPGSSGRQFQFALRLSF